MAWSKVHNRTLEEPTQDPWSSVPVVPSAGHFHPLGKTSVNMLVAAESSRLTNCHDQCIDQCLPSQMLGHPGHPLLMNQWPWNPSQGREDDCNVPLIWQQIYNCPTLQLVSSRIEQLNCSHCKSILDGGISWNRQEISDIAEIYEYRTFQLIPLKIYSFSTFFLIFNWQERIGWSSWLI